MAGKENTAMTHLMDFAKPCKGKLIGSVILAVLGALCGMIPYLAVSRGIIMICHEDYAFSKLAFLALIAFAGYLGQVWFGTFSTMKSHESAFIILRNIRMAITEKLSRSLIRRPGNSKRSSWTPWKSWSFRWRIWYRSSLPTS